MALERSLISLFSGAGGLDIGLERAGWETVAASDFSTDCVRTLRNSQEAEISVDTSGDRAFLAGARLLEADIANLRASDLRPNGASPDWRPSLLAGGPPCQPWSSAGLQRGFEDPRGRVVEHYFRLTEELRPRFVLFENVRGLLTAVGREGKPGEALTAILDTFASIGYATRVALVNAADFGAAQRRVRLFVLGSIDHDLPTIPEPTHSREAGSGSGHLPWVSLGGLLATVPAPDEAEGCAAERASFARLVCSSTRQGLAYPRPHRGKPPRRTLGLSTGFVPSRPDFAGSHDSGGNNTRLDSRARRAVATVDVARVRRPARLSAGVGIFRVGRIALPTDRQRSADGRRSRHRRGAADGAEVADPGRSADIGCAP